MLGGSPAAVKGSLQRARRNLDRLRRTADRDQTPLSRSRREREITRRLAAAFEADDMPGVVALLTGDAWLAMPPAPHEYHGPAAVTAFLGASASWRAGRRFRLVATRASTQPAFGCYLSQGEGQAAEASGLYVLTLDGDRICGLTRFLDDRVLLSFGLPPG